MNSDHLRALVSAVDHGTFDAAADALRISGSAFSQRVKALERQVGQVLLARTVPVRPTPAGERMLRLARQTLALEEEALASLGRGDGGRVPVRVALNADSLDTWWEPVLREAATWDDVVLQLRTEDQEHTASLLRDGTVVAAVTDDPTPVSGCTSTPLGTMRYHAVCASFLLEMHRDERGRLDLAPFPGWTTASATACSARCCAAPPGAAPPSTRRTTSCPRCSPTCAPSSWGWAGACCPRPSSRPASSRAGTRTSSRCPRSGPWT